MSIGPEFASSDEPPMDEFIFHHLVETQFDEVEIRQINVRSWLEAARRESGPAQDILGHPDEECNRCGTINIPPEDMEKDCPYHGLYDA